MSSELPQFYALFYNICMFPYKQSANIVFETKTNKKDLCAESKKVKEPGSEEGLKK